MSLIELDTDLLVWINSHNCLFADSLMWLISTKWIWIPLYVLLIVLTAWRTLKEGRRGDKFYQSSWFRLICVFAVFAAVVGLSDFISSGIIKHLVCRLRPTQNPALEGMLHIVNGYRGGKYGFVSSHAANTFSCALLFSLLWKNRNVTLLLMLWVLLNCYSRMYLGVHYPLDILGGLAVGGAMATMGYFIIKSLGLWNFSGQTAKLKKSENSDYSEYSEYSENSDYSDKAKFPLLLLFLLLAESGFAQQDTAAEKIKPKFLYNIDFLTYFDNREYKKTYQYPQTLFAFRLSPEIGIGIDDKNGGQHKLIAGLHYLQPLGGNWSDIKVHPTAFYQLKYKGLTLNMGAVPYKYFIRQLPDFMRYDSIAYYHPNIQGALFQYESKLGFIELMCDWYGMQTTERREMFRLTADGEYHHKGFFTYIVGGVAQMGHKANMKDPTPHEGVADDMYVSPNIGIDFAPPTPLDTLSLRASYIYGFQQFRHHEKHQPQGMMIEFMLRWRMLGAKNTFYYGENLMPLYGLFAADLNQGDPFYQAKLYNRTDLYVYLYNNSFINCYFSWNMHYIRETGLQYQQQLFLLFSLDGLHKKQRLKGLFDK